MYRQFYNLAQHPFEISPDPHFFFPTAQHHEALASIYHGVLRHRGFVVVTGEVGTGKTLLVRCLLDLLRRQQISFATVFNPRLTPGEFLRYVLADFGIKLSGIDRSDKGSLLFELNHYLVTRHKANSTTVLVVDEAQHLSSEVLEEIRLLTNLETPRQKLLQIVLSGQPELEQKLDSPQLRQLKQRVAFRCRLIPLAEEETRGYILRRLQRAGANSNAETIFPDPTIAAVYRHSKGIPRLINTICENALIAAYALRATSVPVEVVDEVASDLRLNVTVMPALPAPPAEGSPQAVAKSVLQLIEALEHLAQGPDVQHQTTEVGAKA
jgi:general secretion pathway protein A